MLIMGLLVLSIGFLQNGMDLLMDVLNPFNELGGFFGLRLNMGQFYLCGRNRYCDINGTHQLKSQTHLKGFVVGRAMESSIVDVLNIGETRIIPCEWMLRVLHVKVMNDHPIDDLCLGVEGSGICELGVQ